MKLKSLFSAPAVIKSPALLIKHLSAKKSNTINEVLPSIDKLSKEDNEELSQLKELTKLGKLHNFVVPFAFRLKEGSLGNKLFRTDTEFVKKIGKAFSYPAAVIGYFSTYALLASLVPSFLCPAIGILCGIKEAQFANGVSAGTMAGYAVGSNLGYALSIAGHSISNTYHAIVSKLTHKAA